MLPLVKENYYHRTLNIKTKYIKDAGTCKLENNLKYNFAKEDFFLSYNQIRDTKWDNITKYKTYINLSVKKFYELIFKYLDECIPKIRYTNKYPKWYTKEIICDLKRKRHFVKKYKKYDKKHTKTNQHDLCNQDVLVLNS